jgi:acetate---CoA ligase (ADP-forming)
LSGQIKLALVETREQKATRARLERLLRPRSIAIVGASETPGSLGESVLANLEMAGYKGDLYLVNPKRSTIHGRECLGAIDELPDGVDCAVLAIPGAAILSSVRSCAEKRVGSAIIFSAGFAEAGEEGRTAQSELSRIARECGIVLEGPNCLGMVNYIDRIPLTFVLTSLQVETNRSGAAILSQSGALAAVIAVNIRHHAILLTYSVSTGNEAATGIEDFVEYLLDDAKTRVLAVVAEQFRDPNRFLKLARRARDLRKFIVLLHPGRSDEAKASAATHTGAIAGDYQVMHTLVTHEGVIHVESLEELVDVVQLLVRCTELPRGGAAVFTESGAFKAHTLDICEAIGLKLPKLSESCVQALRNALPAFISPSNPLDITAQGLVDPDLYQRTLPAILDDEGLGSVVLGIILTDAKTTRLKLPPIVTAIRALKPQKPVLFAALDEGAPFDFIELEELRQLGVACFPSSERALRALAHVTRRAMQVERRDDNQASSAEFSKLPSGLLSEAESKKILKQIGITIPDGRVAATAQEALQIAAEIGYPVVLKVQSPDLPHKSDVGGVVLGIRSETELLEGWSALHSNVKSARPELVPDGVLVERMGNRGLELIIGARRDPQWGPVVLAGFGGVLAEAIGDVQLMPPDLSRDEIEQNLSQLRCAPLLKGFRGAPEVDVAAVTTVVQTIGRLMRSCPEVGEVDINPLVVYEKGKGAVALDGLIAVNK